MSNIITGDQAERLLAHAERGVKEHILEAAQNLVALQAKNGNRAEDWEAFDAVLEDAIATRDEIEQSRQALNESRKQTAGEQEDIPEETPLENKEEELEAAE